MNDLTFYKILSIVAIILAVLAIFGVHVND